VMRFEKEAKRLNAMATRGESVNLQQHVRCGGAAHRGSPKSIPWTRLYSMKAYRTVQHQSSKEARSGRAPGGVHEGLSLILRWDQCALATASLPLVPAFLLRNFQLRPLPPNIDSIVNLATAGTFSLLVLSP